MDANHVAFELGKLGLLPAALDDGLRRAEAHFVDHPYTPEAATSWAQAQRQEAAYLFGHRPTAPSAEQPVWTTLGLSKEAFDAMPASWRLAQGRAHQPPPPVHSRRPVYRSLTPAELQTLEGVPWHDRQTRARQMQQTPLEPPRDAS